MLYFTFSLARLGTRTRFTTAMTTAAATMAAADADADFSLFAVASRAVARPGVLRGVECSKTLGKSR